MRNNDKENSIESFVINWNIRYPIDYWWRKKHGIIFGSRKHREASFFDMIFEFKEEKVMARLFEEMNEDSEESIIDKEVDKMFAPQGKKTVNMSKKEIDKEFDDLDLNDLSKISYPDQKTT